MNRLQEVLETEPSYLSDQFEKTFKKVFGIPAQVIEYDGGNIFKAYEETFSIDHEGTLLWNINNKWETVYNIDEARQLWKNQK